MEKQKVKLRLNLFDAIVLLVVLIVGALVLWQMLDQNSAATTTKTGRLTYQITIKEASGGTSDYIPIGSHLIDAVKNYDLGEILSLEVLPAEKLVLNHDAAMYQKSTLEGYEDIVVELAVDVSQTESALLIDGGYDLRVGDLVYMRGAGYMAAGYVTRMDRLG